MLNEHPYPKVDDELIRLKGYAAERGHIKLATYGTKKDLIKFKESGFDCYRQNRFRKD